MREIQILDFLHYKCNICIQRIQESEELRKHIVCMHIQLYENMKTTRNMETWKLMKLRKNANLKTWKHENTQTWKLENMEPWKHET